MASACIIVDGEIVAAAHEERFTRIKSDVGFPYHSIKFCLSKTGLSGKDIDVVALSNESFNLNGIANILFKRQSKYSIDDWIYENKHYWFRKFFKNQLNNKSYFEIMGGNNRAEKHYYDFRKINFSGSSKNASISFNIERKNVLKKNSLILIMIKSCSYLIIFCIIITHITLVKIEIPILQLLSI